MTQITPISFIKQVIKPYRKWYVFLCLAPLFQGVYFALNNYIIKTIIDTITGEISGYEIFILPLSIFLAIEILSRFLWSLHDYSEYKLHGNIFRDLIIKTYDYLQNHSYTYFQNNFGGSLVSKLKGISDGFYQFWDKISHNLLESFSIILGNIIMIAFLSMKLLPPVLLYIIVMGLICYIQSAKYDKMAFVNRKNWHLLLGKVSDKVTNMFTIFQFAKKDSEINEIKNHYEKIGKPDVDKLNYYNYKTWLWVGIVNTIMTLGIFIYAIYLRKIDAISTGVLTITILIVLKCVHEIFSLINNALSFIQNLADFKASLDGIFVKQDVIDKKDARDLVI
ncbi:ABC transporter transmembrane domain-containing protein [Candidatus Deianiraea vastatrix]|uniref:ABC transporter ATP-binding/permease domain protein n=1 Tax=Candidatus Deianiraea vastatrix TaxID=2163644 RepID=A0A5B8XFT4_9RICK|nr:ABC transporter transmembrane domain-containing protein [Candidatus Deianiraea vastatrix]QED22857.1 Putative ABC transporter ATP-binding/permease domain protein [Candidatus Deianiraea vastatrix]